MKYIQIETVHSCYIYFDAKQVLFVCPSSRQSLHFLLRDKAELPLLAFLAST